MSDNLLTDYRELIEIEKKIIRSQDKPNIPTWSDFSNQIGEIHFDWYPWLPSGFLTLVASASGEGKSGLLMRLCGCYTNQLPWPDGALFSEDSGVVLWAEAEGAQVLNEQRAIQWGLDLSKIISPFDDFFKEINLDLPEHREALTARAFYPGVKIIVVDSLSGSTNKKENDTEAKTTTQFLARLARDTQKPIVISHHLNKPSRDYKNSEVTLDRVRGSSSIIQMARSVWAIDTPDPENKEIKRLSVIKHNLAAFPKPLGFSFTEDGIIFTEAPKTPHIETLTDKAVDLLLALLSQEPMESGKIYEKFAEANISRRKAWEAKSRLKVETLKRGVSWYWSLPSNQ